MPCFDIIRNTTPKDTFRVSAVVSKFDINSRNVEERFVGEIDLDWDWSVGLIVGMSGTGKTTIAKELFKEKYINSFNYTDNAILDDMPSGCTVEEITKAFNSVGFSSPPSWLKQYKNLSNGEKMRVDLANSLLSDNNLVVFDEFTSVVDRTVAKVGSYAVQKAIRNNDKKFVAVTCHEDVEEWLMPDWVFNTNNMMYSKTETEKKNQKWCSEYTRHNKKQSFGDFLQSITI